MKRTRQEIVQLILIAWVILGLVALYEINLHLITSPSVRTDFLAGWAGTRWFIYNGWSPYSQSTTEGIEEIAYGRKALSGETSGFFLFPFYAIFMFFPFSLIKDFHLASTLWITASQLVILATLFLSLQLCSWKPSKWLWLGLMLFVFTWYHTLQPMIQLDFSIWSAFFIVLALWLIHKRHDGLAGLALALAALEPEAILLPWALITLWGISQKRWVLVLSPILGTGLLSAAAAIFLPDWIPVYAKQMIYMYLTSTQQTPGELLAHWMPGVGMQTGWVLTVVSLTLLIVEGYALWGKDVRRLVWVVFLGLVLVQICGTRVSLEDYFLMLPAILLVLSIWNQRWGRFGLWLMGLFFFLLSIGLWAIVLDGVRRSVYAHVDARVVLFSPIIVLVGMLWVRWWAIRPAKLPLEILSERLG